MGSANRINVIRMHIKNANLLYKMQLQNMSSVKGASEGKDAGVRISQFLESVFSHPDVSVLSSESRSRAFKEFYSGLNMDEKLQFLKVLSSHYGVNQDTVVNVAKNVTQVQERGDAILLKVEERLRNALIPRYQVLFGQIGRFEGGVKFLVDLRADLLHHLGSVTSDHDAAFLRALNVSLRDLLSLWFSVGFLNLQRITWHSPCDMVQKISDYEAVHPIRSWTDLKQRVGPYRRCFVFTHSSMPREPVVVLHTALCSEISSTIHSIIRHQAVHNQTEKSKGEKMEPVSTETEDPGQITTAVFYSITSTQRGLQSVDLGNYLIKQVVRELQAEFPRLNQFSSMSPIPGFREWLIGEINKQSHNEGESKRNLLTEEECESLKLFLENKKQSIYDILKKIIVDHSWVNNEQIGLIIRKPLMRLCARYLYVERRRGFALNPVANFHLGNGAVIWRLNWMADVSIRGLTQSCGLMVNYRYFLDTTEDNSKKYLENHDIQASQQIKDLTDFQTALESQKL
ncbi:hypothetical protein ScPMuIL_013091 [Solemya velum]